MSSYSFNIIFIETNSSCVILESVKALEIKNSMFFNLDFAVNTTLAWSFCLFLIIDLYFQILAVITQIITPIAELVIPTGIPTKEAKAEMETHPVPVETKISKCSI